jgi:MFS family permease
MTVRNEWLLVVFTATTNLADAVTKVALPFLATTLTDSPAAIAGVATTMTLPWLVTALHVGVLVDRMSRRTLMAAAETARLLAIGVLLIAIATNGASLPLVYLIAAVLGVAEVVALTAGASIIPSAVPKRHLQRANARITGVEYLCNGFLGAPVGGFLTAAGIGLALGTTGIVYAVGVVLLAMLAGNFTVTRDTPKRAVHTEIREGLTFLWRHTLLRTMALLIAVMAGCWSAWLALLPSYATSQLGLNARGYGLLLTCLGAGGVLGALGVGLLNRMWGRRWSMFLDVTGSFALVATPVLVTSPAAVGAAAFLAGLGGTLWTVNSRVICQSLVPGHLLGRFNAASRLVGWGTAPVAAALGGVLAQLGGFRLAFGVFAVLAGVLVYPYLKVVTARAIALVDPAAAPRPGTPVPSH